MSDHLRLDQLPAGAAQVGVLMDVARRLWEPLLEQERTELA